MTPVRARTLPKSKTRATAAPSWRGWEGTMMALVCLGLAVAGYMAYSDLSSTSLVCSGLGDCDTAHASVYARLLGVPVSVLGFAAYVGVAALLIVRRYQSGDAAYLALLAVLVIALAGSLFSAYLTYVELFVIAAVCPWCVLSAATMATLVVVVGLRVRRDLART